MFRGLCIVPNQYVNVVLTSNASHRGPKRKLRTDVVCTAQFCKFF